MVGEPGAALNHPVEADHGFAGTDVSHVAADALVEHLDGGPARVLPCRSATHPVSHAEQQQVTVAQGVLPHAMIVLVQPPAETGVRPMSDIETGTHRHQST
mgnify:CR=1 FL=1